MICAYGIEDCPVCKPFKAAKKEVMTNTIIFDVRGKQLKIGTNVVYPARGSTNGWLDGGKIESFTLEDDTGTIKNIKIKKKNGSLVTVTRLNRLAAVVK